MCCTARERLSDPCITQLVNIYGILANNVAVATSAFKGLIIMPTPKSLMASGTKYMHHDFPEQVAIHVFAMQSRKGIDSSCPGWNSVCFNVCSAPVCIGPSSCFTDVSSGKYRFGVHMTNQMNINSLFHTPETAITPPWRAVFTTDYVEK